MSKEARGGKLRTGGQLVVDALLAHGAQDSTPMLLLVGQVARPFLGREAFQEVDFTAMFRPLAYASIRRRSARATRSTHVRAVGAA